jgi:hypothetical protein
MIPNEVNNIGLAAALFAKTLKELKHDGFEQACCVAALIDVLKNNDVLNDSVDMAVSYNGRVIRNEK